MSVRDLGAQLGVLKDTVHRILQDYLHMWKVCSAWVPHILTTEQVQHRVEIYEEWRRCIKPDPSILSRIITADETWIYYFDILSNNRTAPGNLIYLCGKKSEATEISGKSNKSNADCTF